MKIIGRIAALISCCSAILFGGCKDHILDGPGMVYEPQWTEFTVSHSGSMAESNYWFTVTIDEKNAVVAGDCVNRDHWKIETEDIPISGQTVWQLYRLNLEMLENVKQPETDDEAAEIILPEVMILDDTSASLSLTLSSGETVDKAISDEIALEIYNILVPYFDKT